MSMFGQRLRLARKRSGYSMQELSERTNPKVTAQAISKYENGKMLPSSSVLVGLGKALEVSLDFLMSSQVQKIEKVEFRRRSQSTARDRYKAEAVIIDRLERYVSVEQVLNLSTRMAWKTVSSPDFIEQESQIDLCADELREAWHLGNDPIASFCELLEDKGLKVIVAELPEEINGVSCDLLQDEQVVTEAVMVSNHVNVERKRFTLAHELAHRVLSDTHTNLNKKTVMNRFAGAFLLPSSSLLAEVGKKRKGISYYEIKRIKRMYGVTAALVLVRLHQVGVLSKAALARAFSTDARKWRTEEPNPIEQQNGFASLEQPRRFERLVAQALSEELISLERASELLDLPIDQVRLEILGLKSN